MRFLGAAALALLSACGYVGPPQPPALYIPQPIADLRVTEVGDSIEISFTAPGRTTEDLPVGSLRAIELRAGPGEANFSPERWEASARRFSIPVTADGAYTFTIPAQEFLGQQLIFAVRTVGRTGRRSEWSNFAILTVEPPLRQPRLAAENVAEGVRLRWTGNAPRYQVQRAAEDAKPLVLAETDAPEYLDQTTAYGVRYRYSVIALADEFRRSPPSEPVEITPTDVFPPAIPTGLSAVAGPGSIELSWNRSPDEDLAGYTVYRAEGDAPVAPYAAAVAIPAFADTRVEAGKRYRYAVTATDMAGNESPRSEEVSARVD
jgi:hypothetical protein